MKTWIFQANPDTFDISGYLAQNREVLWTVRQARLAPEMRIGDRVFFWRASGRGKDDSGIIAAAHLTSEPTVQSPDQGSIPFWRGEYDFQELRVRLCVERVANNKETIRREWLQNDPILSDLRILRLAAETNFEIAPPHTIRLEALWRNTGRDWNRTETLAGLWAYHHTFGCPVSITSDSPVAEVALAIGRAVQGVYNKVMNFRSLDPRDPLTGLSRGGHMAESVWREFYADGRLDIDAIEIELEGTIGRFWSLPRLVPSAPAFEVVQDVQTVRRAQQTMVARLKADAEGYGQHAVGYRGGNTEAEIYYRADLNLWAAFAPKTNRTWNAFGFGRPEERRPIIVEINLPLEGIDRRIAGVVVTDTDGELYLAHRGNIGGGRDGINKSAFVAALRREGALLHAVQDGDRISNVVLVGALADPHLPALIAQFGIRVQRFKDGANGNGGPADSEAVATDVSPRFSPEFDGKKEYRTIDRVTATCTHGIIVNSLEQVLRQRGCKTSNDRHRDLVLHDGAGKARAVFEIKPGSESYPIYQAIGQLFFHTAGQPDVARIAVLPESTAEEDVQKLRLLGIHFVGFTWEGQALQFTGLDGLQRELAPVAS